MILRVALDTPLPGLFDYRWSGTALTGQRVIVPWGRQTVMGLVLEIADHSSLDAARIKDAVAVLDDVDPLPADWIALVRFAAGYYHRPVGEVALPALPTLLRRAASYRSDAASSASLHSRSMTLLQKKLAKGSGKSADATPHGENDNVPVLNAEQAHAYAQIRHARGFSPILLHGVTGSGKTEVYLHAVGEVLDRGEQVLVLVPEINLTPQLEQVFRMRFPGAELASLHSGLADGERAVQWLAAHTGRADIILGTRMAVLASMPRLGMIVVDEEHDPSFKQQEGLRYSARDLAIVRAQQRRIPVILGSATPSLESWMQAQRGKYTRLSLTVRASAASSLPSVRILSIERVPLEHGFSAALREAIGERLARREQVLIFHNRRGYAPVLTCNACGWVSDCSRCSAHAVFHKNDGRLHCHHCGWEARVPRACPTCGNVDLAPLGRGTQRIEEALAKWFPEARLLRIDRDSTRRKGSAESMLASVHAGEVDILVGTQMVAKGHDFRNLTLVGVVDADAALFSHDFRAGERLFSNLMQVAGRAGRAEKPGEVLIQTRFPQHPLFGALVAQDFSRFAASQLAERRGARLPPYSHQAILRAEGRSIDLALAFLRDARAAAAAIGVDGIDLYDPVPMNLLRLANIERAQLLIESASRPALQAFLPLWLEQLRALKGRMQWHVEVDPLEI